jgi:hypothetical protein
VDRPVKASWARIALARLHQRVGLPGIVGPVLVALALGSGAMAWREHKRDPDGPVASTAPSPVAVPHPKLPGRMPLRPSGDVPLLLTRIERAALDQGLGWPQADYRFNAASEDTPASLEVHCTLKGPYPKIRRFVATLLQDTPALTMREFSLARPNADAAEVETKLGVVVYLASAATPRRAASGVTP